MAFIQFRIFNTDREIKISLKQIIFFILILIVIILSNLQVVTIMDHLDQQFETPDNYYIVFKLDPSKAAEYTQKDIKKAYRKLAISIFPDKMPNNDETKRFWQRVSEAASILLDERLRKVYDEQGYHAVQREMTIKMKEEEEKETKFEFEFGK